MKADIDYKIAAALNNFGWGPKTTISEGRLMALELMSKASCGYYNSHTEEAFLLALGIMKKDRKPNKKGFNLIHDMVYASSNKRPLCFKAMEEFRS